MRNNWRGSHLRLLTILTSFFITLKIPRFADNTKTNLSLLAEYGEYTFIPIHTYHVRYSFLAILGK